MIPKQSRIFLSYLALSTAVQHAFFSETQNRLKYRSNLKGTSKLAPVVPKIGPGHVANL